MKSTILHVAAMALILAGMFETAAATWAQGESLAPATHGKKPGGGGGGGGGVPPRPFVQAGQANPMGNLFVRLGLTGNKGFATGRYFAVHQNGQIAHILGSYKVMRDGRFMMFPVAVNTRIDVHSAKFFPATQVIGARTTGINLTTARNTGGGIINFGMKGTGFVTAQIQDQFQMVGTHAMPIRTPILTIRFIPN